MMEQPKNKSQNCKAVVDFKIFAIIFTAFSMMIVSPKEASAQSTCNDYYNGLNETINRLFTASRHQEYRERNFPTVLQQVLPSEIRRLNFPEEQWVCDAALEAIRGDEPVPERERAMYKVKDHYFMVAYSYITDEQGNQLIDKPAAGVLYDPHFNLIALVMM